MPVRFYVTIEGSKQGKFRSEAGSQHGGIEGTAFSCRCEYSISATGQISSKRRHSPIAFTKVSGAASPQLLQAMYTNEPLKLVRFDFLSDSQDEAIIVQRVTLTSARVLRVDQRLAVAGEGHSDASGELVDDVSLAFQEIKVVNVPGGTEAVDTWVQ